MLTGAQANARFREIRVFVTGAVVRLEIFRAPNYFPGMRGRKPKPTFLHALHGNPSRLPPRVHEPMPVGDLVDDDAPEWFPEEMRAVWSEAIASTPRGLLKKLDRDALVLWTVAAWVHREASRQLNAAELIVTVRGRRRPHVLTKIVAQQSMIMLKAASDLGFTPLSRTGLAR